MSDSEQEEQKREEKENIREILTDLAEKGEIDKTPAAIKKSNEKTLEKTYAEYKRKSLRKTNEMMTGLLIKKFGNLLENLNLVKDGNETGEKRQEKKLFKKDMETLVASVTPWIPFLGIFEGGMVVAEDVTSHVVNTNFPSNQKEEKNPETEEKSN